MAKRKGKSELKPIGMSDGDGDYGSSVSTELAEAPVSLGSAPAPAEAERAITQKLTVPAPAKEQKPSVPLRVFAAVSGIKPDQFQAFARHVTKEELRPCPVLEWKSRYAAFLQKPVR